MSAECCPLPIAHCRAVGPFVFFDEMGPATFPPGAGIDVRPHPHIGLSTITYVFTGAILHRDSLGVVQEITPGAVNWMTAGSGIVHSERTPEAARANGQTLHGIQTWVALPADQQEIAPSFQHHPADSLPVWEQEGVRLVLIAGSAYDRVAPVALPPGMELFYVDATMAAGSTVRLPDLHPDRAVYVVSGDVTCGETPIPPNSMAVLEPDLAVTLTAKTAARVMLCGGTPYPEPRQMFWNFVHTDAERIETAKNDWRTGGFPTVPGETEWIPLPE